MPPWFQLAGVALLAAAVPVGYRGVRWVQRYRRLLASESTDVGQLRAPGAATLSGTVRAASPFASPLSGKECVLMRWRIEEWNEGSRDPRGWQTVASGTFGTRFELDDRTGSVAVDPRDRTPDGAVDEQREPLDGACSLDPDVVPILEDPRPRTTRAPGTVSGRLAEFERAADLGRPSGPLLRVPFIDRGRPDGERRYSERLVGPGDVVSAVGDVVVDAGADRPLGPGDLTVRPEGRPTHVLLESPREVGVRTPTSDELLVSEHPEAETTARLRRMTLLVPLALVLAGLGAGTLAATRGLVDLAPSTFLVAAAVVLVAGFVLLNPPSGW